MDPSIYMDGWLALVVQGWSHDHERQIPTFLDPGTGRTSFPKKSLCVTSNLQGFEPEERDQVRRSWEATIQCGWTLTLEVIPTLPPQGWSFYFRLHMIPARLSSSSHQALFHGACSGGGEGCCGWPLPYCELTFPSKKESWDWGSPNTEKRKLKKLAKPSWTGKMDLFP